MKILLLTLFALVVFPLLMAGEGIAEPTHPNEVGLYLNPDGTGPAGTSVMGAPVDVYLVLTRPTDVEGGGVPYISFYGFECTLHFDPIPSGDLVLLGTVLPPGSLDIGRFKDINEGILEFVVGIDYDIPVPVVNEAVQMAQLTFMVLDSGLTEVFLRPIEPNQSIPGGMAFLGGHQPSGPDYILTPMYSMGGSHDAPAFAFNGEAVAVENENFGSVKALFR